MIRKYETIKSIINSGIIAVLRSKNEEEAELVTKACINGNINIIEVTFSVPNADIVIKKLKSNVGDSIIIGAGTVLDEITARMAILSGADFIVAPNFNKDVALLCNIYGIPYIPGCMTVNEIIEAMKYGVDIIKLFPSDQFNPNFIKSIKAPLPQVNVMVTGGVNIDNTAEWIKSGAVVVGVGGNLTSINDNDYSIITELANKYVNQVKIGRRKV